MNSIPKIYDYILCNRLSKWFIPDSEQAGAQPKRGCLEHKISLRLLIEYAIMKRKKLFIVFVDFSAAYESPKKCISSHTGWFGMWHSPEFLKAL